MVEYIEREEILAAISSMIEGAKTIYEGTEDSASNMYIGGLAAARANVSLSATADVAPVRHGKPVIVHRHFGGFTVHSGVNRKGEKTDVLSDDRWEANVETCPFCRVMLCSRFQNYCPNCGAKMDGGET